ncbi:MAG: alpha/beta hydrolase [Lapillicoccus sp.]
MPSAQRSEELPPREEPPTVHRFGRGDGEAPTLLLLHGLTDSGRCWPDAVRRWSDDYRVVTWDARGHGESDRFTPAELRHGVGEIHLADLVAVLEQLAQDGSTRPVLVGHSMGGGTAAALAGARPDLVRAVVLEDPALGAGRYADLDEAEGARRRVAEARETNTHPHHAMKQGKREHPKWPKAEFKPWLEAKQQTDLEMLGQPSITVRTPWEQVTDAIAVPALLVTGTAGAIWTGDLLARLQAVGNPHVEIEAVRKAGHCVRRDRADDFHAIVDPWVAKQLDG